MNHFDTLGDIERAFLAAITKAPDDDLPRLVFADWIEERGSPTDLGLATAEFIRLSCGVPTKGKGSRAVKARWRGWLGDNWRRLVPTLTVEWDTVRTGDQVKAEMNALFEAHGGQNNFVPTAEGSVRYNLLDREPYTWVRLGIKGHIEAGVPFNLPLYPPREGMRVYVPRVSLWFGRGFLVKALCRAPSLGTAVGHRLARDQPLADLSACGPLPFQGGTVTGRAT